MTERVIDAATNDRFLTWGGRASWLARATANEASSDNMKSILAKGGQQAGVAGSALGILGSGTEIYDDIRNGKYSSGDPKETMLQAAGTTLAMGMSVRGALNIAGVNQANGGVLTLGNFVKGASMHQNASFSAGLFGGVALASTIGQTLVSMENKDGMEAGRVMVTGGLGALTTAASMAASSYLGAGVGVGIVKAATFGLVGAGAASVVAPVIIGAAAAYGIKKLVDETSIDEWVGTKMTSLAYHGIGEDVNINVFGKDFQIWEGDGTVVKSQERIEAAIEVMDEIEAKLQDPEAEGMLELIQNAQEHQQAMRDTYQDLERAIGDMQRVMEDGKLDGGHGAIELQNRINESIAMQDALKAQLHEMDDKLAEAENSQLNHLISSTENEINVGAAAKSEGLGIQAALANHERNQEFKQEFENSGLKDQFNSYAAGAENKMQFDLFGQNNIDAWENKIADIAGQADPAALDGDESLRRRLENRIESIRDEVEDRTNNLMIEGAQGKLSADDFDELQRLSVLKAQIDELEETVRSEAYQQQVENHAKPIERFLNGTPENEAHSSNDQAAVEVAAAFSTAEGMAGTGDPGLLEEIAEFFKGLEMPWDKDPNPAVLAQQNNNTAALQM